MEWLSVGATVEAEVGVVRAVKWIGVKLGEKLKKGGKQMEEVG